MEAHLGVSYVLLLATAVLASGAALAAAGLRPRLAAALPSSERWFLRAALGFVTLTWWAVVLAETGTFGAKTLLLGPALLAVLLLAASFVRGRDRNRRRRFALDGRWIVVVALVLIGAALYFPPYDVRLEARDPGVYFLSGIQLAREGALRLVDPLILEMSPEERAYWFPTPSRDAVNAANRHIGFYVESLETGVVVPQALPIFPAFVAIGHIASGLHGAASAGPVLAILGAVAVFFFVSRWLGPVAGGIASTALATGFVQVWFARYAAAEMAAQGLVAAGLFGLIAFRRHADPAFGWLAAAGLGLAWMAKAEMLLLAPPLLVLLAYDTLRDGFVWRRWRDFWLPLLLLGMHTLVHARLLLWPYYYDLLQQLRLTPAGAFTVLLVGGSAFGTALVVLAYIQRSRPAATRATAERLATTGAQVAAVLLPALFAWGLWLRPGQGWDSANFLHLEWAVSPWLLGAGLAGAVASLLAKRRSRARDAVLFLVITALVAGLLRRQIVPLLPWAYRRWLPLVLPGFLALAGGALQRLVPALSPEPSRMNAARQLLGALVAAAVLAGASRYLAADTGFYRGHEEMPNVQEALTQLTGTLEPGSLIVFEPRTLRGMERLEAILAIGEGFDVLRLPGPAIQEEFVRSALLRAARRGQATYLATTGYIDGLLTIHARPAHEFRYPTQRLWEPNIRRVTYQDFGTATPRRVEEMIFRGNLYRLDARAPVLPLAGELDIGNWDAPYLRGSQFHEVEVDPDGRTARWTRGVAGVWLPGLTGAAETIIVRGGATIPESLGPRSLAVRLDGLELGEQPLAEGWRDYRFAIPSDWSPDPGSVPLLELITDPFSPSEAISGTVDTRSIGIKVDKVGWQPVNPAPER